MSKAIYIEHSVQTKEWWDDEIEGIVTDSLGDGVWPILKGAKLAVGPNKALFLQMKPKFVAHLELVRHLMLIMALLVLSMDLSNISWTC